MSNLSASLFFWNITQNLNFNQHWRSVHTKTMGTNSKWIRLQVLNYRVRKVNKQRCIPQNIGGVRSKWPIKSNEYAKNIKGTWSPNLRFLWFLFYYSLNFLHLLISFCYELTIVHWFDIFTHMIDTHMIHYSLCKYLY